MVAIPTLVVLAIAASRVASTNDALLGAIVVATLVVFLVFFIGVLIFAHKHPAAALLEGADLITWQKYDLAAKGIPHPPDSPAIPDPRAPQQLLATTDEPEE